MEESSWYQRNPWSDDERSLGCARNLLVLAERTGHITKGRSVSRGDILAEANDRVSSLKMIKALRDIETKRKHIDQVDLNIQCRLQDKETRDLTHANVLERRMERVNSVNSHLQSVVSNKDQLISRLQQPYVGDYLHVEADYKRFVSGVIPQLVPILSDLSCHLDNMEWASSVNLDDGQLESLLSDISSLLASLQSSFRTMSQAREVMDNMHRQKQLGS